LLVGDASKAKEKLGWEPKVKFKDLVRIMLEADLRQEGLEPKNFKWLRKIFLALRQVRF
jgi:GDPmannose 4,6-dehydratase